MIKAIMHGCNGKMGQVISNIIENDDNIELVAGIDLSNHIVNTYPVFATIKECNIKADVIIDFANVSAVGDLLEYSIETNTPVVLCTTGLNEEHLNKIKEASKKVAILNSANMSLGINTLFSVLKQVTKVLAPAGYDIEIVEKHHNQKLDAPSGTALALANTINETLENKYEYKYDRSKELAKRGKNEIGIQSVRGGTIVGEHEIIFAGTDEVIEIKHTAYSRAVFGKGAVEAAKFLASRKAGLYDMSHVIDANVKE